MCTQMYTSTYFQYVIMNNFQYTFFLCFHIVDVVYDISIIPPLVKVLKLFLTRSVGQSSCVAYIASTVRNEDTRDQFLIALSKFKLSSQKAVYHITPNNAVELLVSIINRF